MLNLPPKAVIDVQGEAIEYICTGPGPATVVLVNGAGGPIEGWYKVYPALSEHARVLAYNRPGIGRSAAPRCPQTAEHMVGSLRSLLQSLNLAPPYVLVGHSLGGLLVNLFARRHPADMAAVVMLDATSPDDIAVMARHESAVQKLFKALLDKVSPLPPFFELHSVDGMVAELAAAPPFPPIPLTVITGAKPTMAWATRREALEARARHQADLARLSPLGRQVMAPRSGHFPQMSEPALVIDHIRAETSRPMRCA